MSNEVAVYHHGPVTLPDMQTMAKSIAASGMFGVKTEDEAMALMLLCQAEGIHPVMALRRYHIIDHKPAYRADALQGEFEREGAILWHKRDDKECSATFWKNKQDCDADGIKRAKERYKLIKAGQDESDLALPGELTIVRTFDDAVKKGLATTWDDESRQQVLKKNWRQSPRQMLHARCLTEGVRAIRPGLVAGIYTEDEMSDIQPEEYDQRPNSELIERNVREATANATGEASASTVAAPESSGPYGPITVTADNYKERISHVGQPNGNLLGKKVGELDVNVLKWMHDKWINTLRPGCSNNDLALKQAILFAYRDQQKVGDATCQQQTKAGSTETVTSVPTGNAAPTSKPESAAGIANDTPTHPLDKPSGLPVQPVSRESVIKVLRGLCEDLVMTEEQVCGHLYKHQILSIAEKAFNDINTPTLNYILQNWDTAKGLILMNQRLVEEPPKQRRRRK
jgi:hypothetical protein